MMEESRQIKTWKCRSDIKKTKTYCFKRSHLKRSSTSVKSLTLKNSSNKSRERKLSSVSLSRHKSRISTTKWPNKSKSISKLCVIWRMLMQRMRFLSLKRRFNLTNRTWSSRALSFQRKLTLSWRIGLNITSVWKNSYRFWCLNSSLVIWMIWTSIRVRHRNYTMLSVFKRMKLRRRTLKLRLTSCRSRRLRTLSQSSKKTLREELIN